MAVLWPFGPKIFDVKLGELSPIEIKVPRRGVITSISVEQIGGTATGTLQLYDSSASVLDLYPPEDPIHNDPRAKPGTTPPAHSVAPPVQITTGRADTTNLRCPYMNRDGSNSNPVRRLWGVFNLPGTVGQVTQVAISMTIEQVSFV